MLKFRCFFQKMMDFLTSNCTCIKGGKRAVINYEYSDSDTKSVSDIELRASSEQPESAKKTKQNSCWKLKRCIPRTVLKWFGQDDDMSMTKIEKTIKASLLIQKWYRRYMARLEVRRRYTWTIFQTLEYAGEQDQVKLYNFFNALLTHIPQTEREIDSTNSKNASLENLNLEFEDESPDEEYYEPEDKKKLLHYHLEYPYTEKALIQLIEIFRKHRHYRLPPKDVAEILRRSIICLKKLPNVNVASTGITKQLTVCGDLHGKFDDLLVILHKNGLPSIDNPYVFNGDFVDRGKRGLEVFLILLLCLLAIPGAVYLNRGNHEDIIMNQRYGFIREVQSKYKKNHEKLLRLIEGVYRYLPLGTIVNNKVLIVHGGISDITDLDMIKGLDRGRYVSLLRPPLTDSSAPGAEVIDKVEWKQVFDILWSDPQENKGCIPNNLRGAGTYFGPDVTKKFLNENKLQYIVRSHECKPDGYEVCHNNSVITIFSASNYYEVGSNNGAYLKLMGPELDTHFVQYMANSGRRKLNLYQRMGLVESGACKELKMQIMNNKIRLEEAFAEADPESTGYISITQWCVALENITGLQLPWRMLKDKLVTVDPETNKVKYQTTFDVKNEKLNSVQGAHSVVETLYRNKSSLEAIFHIIDKDKSGYISLEEFTDACNLIKQHMPCPVTHEQLEDMCRLMDLNKDGQVDLNEFLESFRMVDPQSRTKSTMESPETVREPSKNETKSNEKDGNNKVNGTINIKEDTNIKVQVDIHPKMEINGTEQETLTIHKNSLKMSPVLSTRRGSQI
ncbi:serine/threonine-protein phosphatase rdgC isoform X1 [Diorhabda carinulata]|uniref:serine/threonine-protein phosphatase rdgC isoform X1 n=2 Tax=Diorhabda carinulata TaxID=1163345 RepID=UPI0025A227E1|nr:serine/threonine-protein phosphatase rdgC isoform X1 [Diorhabda carinulata]